MSPTSPDRTPAGDERDAAPRTQRRGAASRWERAVPLLGVLARYDRRDLPADLNAGLITAVMLVPQAMAYALLAGLPPVVGLYASTVPLLAYALFGSSRQLAVGPVAIVSLLTLTAVSALAEPGSPAFVALAALLMAAVGLVQLALGLARAGYLATFLSHAVISGFTSAAALVIGLSQAKHLLGIDLPRDASVVGLVAEAAARIGQAHGPTVLLGLAGIALLLAVRRYARRLPGPLLLIVSASVATWAFGLHERGVAIVGSVPAGLPDLGLPGFGGGATPAGLHDPALGVGSALVAMAPAALTIALIAFVESVAVARALAARHPQKIDADRELIGLGVANLAGSLFRGYPVTGGFSRSAVNDQAGARTQLAGVITAALVLVTVAFLTDLFFYLPNAVLASIVMVAVAGLIDLKAPRHLWRVKPIDAVTLAVTFAATLSLGIETGILIGVAFSLLVVVARSARPHTAELGWLPKERVFRNVRRFPHAVTWPEAYLTRPDESLYFANMAFLDRQLVDALADRPRLRHVILDMTGVADVDAVAVEALRERARTLTRQEVRLHLAGVKGPVRDVLQRAGWYDRDEASDHLTVEHAVRAVGLPLPTPSGGADAPGRDRAMLEP
ncbi:MAG: sulfate permease [Trueperaceae bacterium]